MFLRLGPRKRRTRHEDDDSHDVPLLVLVPNMLTALALCSGLASVHFALAERWERALAAIVLSAIFDVLDGAAARLLRVQSPFGAVLDSLSDFLAFGIAPAIILHQWVLQAPTTKLVDTLGITSVMMFALCSALRLARFTAGASVPPPPPAPPASIPGATKPRTSSFFSGLPTPAAAGVALVPALLQASGELTWKPPEWAVAIYLLLVAVLMVSTLPMFALKGLRIPRRYAALVFIAIVALFASMLTRPWLTIAGVAIFYLLLTPLAMLLQRRQKRAARAA
jgi:CDP-diacylglycerol---serine O-phosphatidyltransferase